MASEVAGDDAGGKVGGVGEGVGDAEVGKDGTQDDANATKMHQRMHAALSHCTAFQIIVVLHASGDNS